MNTSNKDILVLAGLLHDIGKFFQRADPDGTKKSKFLSAEVKNLEGQYCPVYKGRYSHKHVLWTAQFLVNYESYYKKLIGDQYAKFFKAAVAHHQPDQNDIWQMIVQKADHFASGVDRSKDQGNKDGDHENRWDDFKKVQMVSIFENLLNNKNEYQYRLPVRELKTDRSIFPELSTKAGDTNAYEKLWNNFSKEIEELHSRNIQSVGAYIENLLPILNLFTSTVPSSTIYLPDVSLFDHLKSVAAFAGCLFEYIKENETSSIQLADGNSPIALLGGDLSGIQQYIYNVASSEAAKNLKGRSFYLQMLIKNIVVKLLDALALSSVHIVYASGGGFYLLVPNLEKTNGKIEHIKNEIAGKIFSEHRTKLFLAIACENITVSQLMNKRINEAWSNLSAKIALEKRQRFKSIIQNNYEFFFEPIEIGGTQGRDAITGEELTHAEQDGNEQLVSQKIKYLKNGSEVKWNTYQQIELGRRLRSFNNWIISNQRIKRWEKKALAMELCELGYFNYFLDEQSSQDIEQQGLHSADNCKINYIPSLSKDNSNKRLVLKGNNNIFSFEYYGGNDYPKDGQGEPLTFDKLAAAGPGANKLGILRMDIDNLGAIFIRGFDESYRTFSRYSTLSRNLEYFFKGYLNFIWNSSEDFKTKTFIIYSGGDDLFVTGQWSTLIDFAVEVRKAFKAFVCQNPELTISGGIVLVPGKFPIAKAADLAEEAEKKAKSYRKGDSTKNAFCLFDTPLCWDDEFVVVRQIKKELTSFIKNDQLPRGLLNKLINYSEIAKFQYSKMLNPSWKWMLAYDFSRAAKSMNNSDASNFYRQLKIAVFSGQWKEDGMKYNNFLELLSVAARWAELETKTN